MKFVATKTVDQLDLQALHPVRERLVSQRTLRLDDLNGAVRDIFNRHDHYRKSFFDRTASYHRRFFAAE